MSKQPMVLLNVRVPAALKTAAMETADRNDETLSDVIRRALENYIRRHK